jgi:hypothetical protein
LAPFSSAWLRAIGSAMKLGMSGVTIGISRPAKRWLLRISSHSG